MGIEFDDGGDMIGSGSICLEKGADEIRSIDSQYGDDREAT